MSLDPSIHGILVQLPLPKHLNSEAIIQSILPEKDVEVCMLSTPASWRSAIDRAAELSVAALTNTTPIGMSGDFPNSLRDAVYRATSMPDRFSA